MKQVLVAVLAIAGIGLASRGTASAKSVEPLYLLGGHTGEVCCVAFSPDGRLLASVANDALIRIRLWQLPEAKIVRTIDIPLTPWAGIAWPAALTFSPDGRLLAVAAINGLCLYDVDSGASLASRAGVLVRCFLSRWYAASSRLSRQLGVPRLLAPQVATSAGVKA